MSCRTGPSVIFGAFDHMCSDWITFDIADSRPKMLIIERTREWSRLPKMTGKRVPHVELLRISAMATMEGLPNRVFAFRYGHKMHMIRHEAVSANPQVKSPTAFL